MKSGQDLIDEAVNRVEYRHDMSLYISGRLAKLASDTMDEQAFRLVGWTPEQWAAMQAERRREARTLRGRFRAIRSHWYWFRLKWGDRLGTAWDALRGRHDCY